MFYIYLKKTNLVWDSPKTNVHSHIVSLWQPSGLLYFAKYFARLLYFAKYFAGSLYFAKKIYSNPLRLKDVIKSVEVAPGVEKTELFKKGWNFANRTYFTSCAMKTLFSNMDERNSVFSLFLPLNYFKHRWTSWCF